MQKTKITIYIPVNIRKMLDSMYAKHLLGGHKTEYSSIVCEAIAQLHEKEQREEV